MRLLRGAASTRVLQALAADGASPLTLHDAQILYEHAPNGDHAPTLVALRRTA